MKVVLDTNVLVSAALFKNSDINKAFRHTILNHTLLISKDCLHELVKTLHKPKLLKYTTGKDRLAFLTKIQNEGVFIDPNISIQACRDPKDNTFSSLLILQRFHRIRPCSFDGMITYRKQGDNEGNKTSQDKDPPVEGGFVGKVLEPFIHSIPG